MRRDLPREIAALGEEVRELARQRGGALPGAQEWQGLRLALVGYEGVGARAEAELAGPQVMAEHVRQMRLAPEAEPLREALMRAVECALRADGRGYRAAVKALRPVLEELLAGSGAKWVEEISAGHRYVDLFRCAHEWCSYPEGERPAYIPPRPQSADPIVVAGLALRRAAQDLDRWPMGSEAQPPFAADPVPPRRDLPPRPNAASREESLT